MSQFHERKYTRWSDLNLHTPCCICCTPTSEEEEVPSLCRPQLLLPQYSVAQHIPHRDSLSNYCLCNEQCKRRHKSLNSCKSQGIEKLKSFKCKEPEKIKECLELHLIGTQVEEALAEDRRTSLVQHFDLCTAALEALAQYSQSLQISELAAYRVLNISHLLTLSQPCSVNSKPDAQHSTTQFQESEVQREDKLTILQELINHCLKHTALPKYVDKLINDHYIRKKDFCTAAKNFKNFLSNFKLTVSQIEKLHGQYEKILNNYQQSRHVLDLELPKVINIRLVALCEGIDKINTFYSNTEESNKTVTMLKSIREKLCTSDSNTAGTFHVEHSPRPELCQKCNINPVDHK